MKHLLIKSKDNTDVLVNIEKIVCVIERKKGCRIYFSEGRFLSSGAKFDDVVKAIAKGATDEVR